MTSSSLARFAVLAWLALSAGGCATLTPATPPVLRGVTAGHGSWASGGCPPTKFDPPVQEATSPELANRLRARFPPGASSKALIEYLRGQGFRETMHCDNDRSILRMIFDQNGGSLF